MKFLAIEKELQLVNQKPTKQLLREEAEMVYNLQQKSIIREIYFNVDNCAVIILECVDKSEAESILNELPLVKNGFIEFQITELKPYTGFSRLIQI